MVAELVPIPPNAPCPFCGGQPKPARVEHETGPDTRVVRCVHCGAQGGHATTLVGAIRNWNMRPAPRHREGIPPPLKRGGS